MGSTEEGGGGQGHWWESPTLSPVDLRQHSGSWNLAADAATASLLQTISQRLVSRTHEVEGMLQKVLEETDRVSAAILNTSNSFHMLANTQFIENRTYQDDADVAKSKPPAVQTKPPVTEEDVITRCKAAISAGLDLVNQSYERHEIQDSESEDEDGSDSPVPVYALIDPYENKPLPYIIGSRLFMEDNRVGLQDPSSEENSKTTITPEETDSEAESEDLEIKKNKPIPASSSKFIEDESDSDLTDDDVHTPAREPMQNNIHRPPQMSSEEDDDDDDDDFFGPPAKATQRITNNGPNLADELNNKFGNTTTAASSTSNDKGIGFDSDSDEDGDLFGRRPEPTSGFFGSSTVAPASREEETDSSVSRTPSSAPSVKSRTGVENVRAMPNPSKIQRTGITRPTPVKSDLFASDTDDDGDLFSSKPRSTSISSSASKVPVIAKIPTTTVSTAVPSTKPSSGGLFSSDGEEEEEEGGLFGSKTSSVPQGARVIEEEKPKEETPAISKSTGRKVPVGGVSMFGGADITKALKRQQSPDSDQSSDDSDWGSSQKSSTSAKKSETNDSSNVIFGKQEPPSLPKTVVHAASAGGGLFDDDDDEEDDLFGSAPKKNVSVSNKTNVDKTNLFSTTSASDPKKMAEKGVVGNNVTNNQSSLQPERKIHGGLFSDDDDDLFGVAVASEKRPATLPVNQAVNESSARKQSVNEKIGEQSKTVKHEDAVKKHTPALKVPDTSKSSSLFSSPSDDDDDLFSVPKVSQPPRSVTIAATEPPPLPSAESIKPVSDIFGSPPSDNDLFSTPATIHSKLSKDSENNAEGKSSSKSVVDIVKEEPPPIKSSNIFSSPSDDDDLFSIPSAVPKVAEKTKLEKNTIESSDKKTRPVIEESEKSKLDKPKDNTATESPDDLFTPKVDSKTPGEKAHTVTSSKSESHLKTGLFASTDEEEEDDIFSGLVPRTSSKPSATVPPVLQNDTKKSSLFDLPDSDEDIFAVVPNKVKENKDDVQVTVQPKLDLLENSDEEDIFNSFSSQPQNQKDTVPTTVKKSTIPPPVTDRESPPALPPDPADSQNSQVENENRMETPVDKPQKPAFKPPVGGVALFGGSELASKINKRKSQIEEVTKDDVNEKSGGTSIGNQHANEEKEIKKDTDDIFGANDDDIFGSAIVTSKSSSNLIGRTSPPPLPTEPTEVPVKPAEVPVKPAEVPVKPADVPVKPTEASVKPTEIPVKPTEVPVKPTEVPVKPTEVPVKPTEAPVKPTEAPVKPTEAPVKPTEAPVKPAEVPVKPTDVPVKSIEVSVKLHEDKEPKSLVNDNLVCDSNKDSEQKGTQEKAEALEENKKEINVEKPKKKPPVGGVSLFGGGGLGGSELFAKVKQRKSRLAPESSDDDDDHDSNTSSSVSSKPEEKGSTASKSSRSSSIEAVSPVSPLSAVSPISPLSPVFPSMPSSLPSQQSQAETAVSFDEPVTNSTTLQSINKNRARGSIKRRPPSRAHRRGETKTTDEVDTLPTSTPNQNSDVVTHVNDQIPETKKESTSPDMSVTDSKDKKVVENTSKTNSASQERTNESDVLKGKEPDYVKESPPSLSGKSKVDFGDGDDDDLFGKPRSASNTSKPSSGGKILSSTQPPSLFGENDSDDDDLFGVSKSKTSSGASSGKVKSTQQNSTKSSTSKPSTAQSLFGDDDDDIFTSASKVGRLPSNTHKKSPAVKPKSNLKPSNEPFDDPLLGNAK